MDNEIIRDCKQFLNDGDFEGLKEYYRDILWSDAREQRQQRQPDWPYIFHRVYIHACLKGRKDAAEWLSNSVFPNLDEIQRIALRQIFPYGRLLLNRAAQKSR
jgi:hypothetical protein